MGITLPSVSNYAAPQNSEASSNTDRNASGASNGASSSASASSSSSASTNPLNMRVSSAALDLVKNYETWRPNAYKDGGGVWTIGWGHTGGVKSGDKITQAQGEQLLRGDMTTAENAVGKLVKVPLTQGQFDALSSFTFNEGSGQLKSSTLLRKLNAGDYAGAQAEFGKWVYGKNSKGNEVIQPGLITRRQSEADLFGNEGPQGGSGGEGTASTSSSSANTPAASSSPGGTASTGSSSAQGNLGSELLGSIPTSSFNVNTPVASFGPGGTTSTVIPGNSSSGSSASTSANSANTPVASFGP